MKSTVKKSFNTREEELQIVGDLVRIMGEEGKAIPRETVRLLRVGQGADLRRIEPDPRSPVLLLGDSHTLVFHDGDDLHATGAGLPDLLARELGFAVDLLGIRGSASTAVRVDLFRAGREDPQRLACKKAVIYCFTSRELSESPAGWRPLPVGKPSP